MVDLNAGGAGNDVTTAFTEQTPVLIAPVGTLIDVDSADPDLVAGDTDSAARWQCGGVALAQCGGDDGGLRGRLDGELHARDRGCSRSRGSATTAVYQSILQGIQYNDTSNTPNHDATGRSTWWRTTGHVNSATQTVTLTVAAVNDAPTATNLSAAETYTEDTALNLINIVVSDVDSANVTATLTLSNVAAGSLSTAHVRRP